MDYDYHELEDESSTFAKKLNLEAQIRKVKQGERCIQEFFDVMARLWNQMERLEPEELKKSRDYMKFQEEKRLIQFLLALRHDFKPVMRSLLSRDQIPSLEEAVSELKAKEEEAAAAAARLCNSLSSSGLSLKGKNVVHDEDDLASNFSSLSMKKKTLETYEPTSSSSSAGLMGNVAKFAAASLAVAGVSWALGAFEESVPTTLKILTYNVCFWDLKQQERMKAVGELIELHKPDIICLQEVTSDIYNIFTQSGWWDSYYCSLSSEEATGRIYFCMQLSKLPVKSFNRKNFRNSRMGRELCVAEIEVSCYNNNSQCKVKKIIRIGTSHLESPTPDPSNYNQMNWSSEERVDQAKKSLRYLESCDDEEEGNIIFCGDMNWDDQVDGAFPLPSGWVDAWRVLRPWLKGWTYDTNSNKMLVANKPLQKRLDRFVCKLNDFKLVKISMIGTEAIPGVSYLKEKRFRNRVQTMELPVLPSDHYGLMLEIQSN